MTLDTTTLTIAGIAALLLAKLFLTRRTPLAVVTAKLQAGATVVDVRTQAEFRGGAYKGAINVPLGDLSAKLGRIPKDKPVRSGRAGGRFREEFGRSRARGGARERAVASRRPS